MNILLDFHSRIPIYEQIKKEIKLAISRGELKANDQLPSLRQLSAQLSINVNTIKRALAELEAEGTTYSIAGKGTFISSDSALKEFYQESFEEIRTSALNAKALGATKEQLIEIIEKIYKGDEEK